MIKLLANFACVITGWFVLLYVFTLLLPRLVDKYRSWRRGAKKLNEEIDQIHKKF